MSRIKNNQIMKRLPLCRLSETFGKHRAYFKVVKKHNPEKFEKMMSYDSDMVVSVNMYLNEVDDKIQTLIDIINEDNSPELKKEIGKILQDNNLSSNNVSSYQTGFTFCVNVLNDTETSARSLAFLNKVEVLLDNL